MLKDRLTKIQDRIMKIGLKTGCGHVASAMSCVKVLISLYDSYPEAIIILSKGHGALAQYVILNELGKLPDKMLATYCQDGGLSEHSTLAPEYGIYASTGSLGHGLAIGIGYAIADSGHDVFVVLGDGELDEGSTLESLRIIRKLNIKNIWPVVDANNVQGFSVFEPFSQFETYGSFKLRPFYSIKGRGWGESENKIDSHYQVVTPQVYASWKKYIKENPQTLENI